MKNIHPWILATRPKTLTAALVPFAAGSVLACRTDGVLSFTILLLCISCSLLIQIATNLINDALDCKRGGDTNRRLGPVRVCHAGFLSVDEVFKVGIGCLLLSAIIGIPLIIRGGFDLSVLFGISLLCGYGYTGGPYSISMNGLGEFFAFLFFGIVATTAAFFLQAQYWSFGSVVLGAQIGLLAAAIASINNYRDMQEDASTGKRTLAVRFGAAFAKGLITFLLLTPYLLGIYWASQGFYFSMILPFAVLPLACILVYKIHAVAPSKEYNSFLGMSALHHLLFGILFCIGLWL